MASKRKQHFVPQLLQREFSAEEKQNRVRIYIKNISEFKMTPIKNNFQVTNLYGSNLVAENKFSEVEEAFAPVLKQILKDPKAFKKNNMEMTQEMADFFGSLVVRNPMKLSKLGEQIYPLVSKDNFDFRPLLASETLAATNREYELFEFKDSLYLPDTIPSGLIPLSPHCLLTYSGWTATIKEWYLNGEISALEKLNALFVEHSANGVIVDTQCNRDNIKKYRLLIKHK
ncbi:ParA-like ATPase involved in chromosome/plasmid partitioning or cellulose biosynthesis protein BcsQ (ParA) [Fructobacillus fructosus]|uniref:DUF4238 domain-containing protein n=1 Tax=Fructobacillus fructosus TaxID=1631 RepID=UPI002DB44B09|nr:ParA-like ATPase involved in chromosome/plasmid partitioning or cellulose biosynthesis protein BcsQ (ParA) [Fructobacillus fructosus]